MRNPGFIIIILITFSCSIMKFETQDFIENEYVFNGGQGGPYILRFSNKDVWYSERGGLFTCSGIWEFTEDRKNIVVKVTTTGSHPLSGKKSTISEYRIKNKDTLVGEDGMVYIRKK
jgi:hypothetical protein